MKLILEIAVATLLTIAALLSFAKGAQADGIVISEAVAEASIMPGAKTGAAYFVIKNDSNTEDQLISIITPAAEITMLHKSTDTGGTMSMEHIDRLTLAPGQSLDMIKDGYHVMLVGLASPLKVGDEFTLKLTFAKAGDVVVKASVAKGVKLKR